MQASIKQKLQQLLERSEEIEHLLGDTEVIADQQQFQNLSREYARLEPVSTHFRRYCELEQQRADAAAMAEQEDQEMKAMAAEEVSRLDRELEALADTLQRLLLPEDPNDQADIFLEIRAGSGGDEAALFAGDLYRMYARFAERQNWQISLLNTHEGEHGGFKEVIAKVSGQGVFSQLKFESGTHRVQRVPATESQGRIHTSACTVAVLPEVKAIDEITIQQQDIKIDTFRASGAGGQHVNTTDSAIRVTHLPSGIVVECQSERSQHKNRASAMTMLQSRLLQKAQAEQAREQADNRRLQVGSGDRSERIRTYNFPQGRLTDHRINLTLYKLNEILEGNLEPVIQPLIREHQAEQLLHITENQ